MNYPPGFDYEDGSCKQCANGRAVQRKNGKTGVIFHGCTNFPECRNSEPIRERPYGSLLCSADDMDLAYYEAFRGDKGY